MDLTGKTVWQHAAGDANRNYGDICTSYQVILTGPGYAGPWPACEASLKSDNWTSKKLSCIRRFAEEMKDGDVVVLKIGTKEVVAIGEIVGEYEYHHEFGDMDGWDLQHVRRVRWLWYSMGDMSNLPAYSMKFGDTTQRLSSGIVYEFV